MIIDDAVASAPHRGLRRPSGAEGVEVEALGRSIILFGRGRYGPPAGGTGSVTRSRSRSMAEKRGAKGARRFSWRRPQRCRLSQGSSLARSVARSSWLKCLI